MIVHDKERLVPVGGVYVRPRKLALNIPTRFSGNAVSGAAGAPAFAVPSLKLYWHCFFDNGAFTGNLFNGLLGWLIQASYLGNVVWELRVAGQGQIGASSSYPDPHFGGTTYRSNGAVDIPNNDAVWSLNTEQPPVPTNAIVFDDAVLLGTIDGLSSETLYYRHVIPPVDLVRPIDSVTVELTGPTTSAFGNGGTGMAWAYFWHCLAAKVA